MNQLKENLKIVKDRVRAEGDEEDVRVLNEILEKFQIYLEEKHRVKKRWLRENLTALVYLSVNRYI